MQNDLTSIGHVIIFMHDTPEMEYTFTSIYGFYIKQKSFLEMLRNYLVCFLLLNEIKKRIWSEFRLTWFWLWSRLIDLIAPYAIDFDLWFPSGI